MPAKSGTVGRAHIQIFLEVGPIQPPEINCVPKYTVAQRFGRGTVWYRTDIIIHLCEKLNGISVITFNWVICINVGAPRQRYKLRAQKENPTSLVRKKKSGTFHDLAGHLVKKRDCPAKSGTVGRSAAVSEKVDRLDFSL